MANGKKFDATPERFEDFDIELLAYYAQIRYSDMGRGYVTAGALARALLAERGIDYRDLEYRVGNYDGTHKSAVLKNGEFLRFVEE